MDEWFGAQCEQQRLAVTRLCAAMTGAPDAAEDIAQEAITEAWRCRARLHDPAGFDRWLAQIARNLCRRWIRQHAQDQRVAPLLLAPESVDPIAERWSALATNDLLSQLHQALAHLDAATGAALLAHAAQNEPLTAIAARMDVRPGTLAVRLHRARQYLAQHLAQHLTEPPMPAAEQSTTWCPFCGNQYLHVQRAADEYHAHCPGCQSVHNASFFIKIVRSAAYPQRSLDYPSVEAAFTDTADWITTLLHGQHASCDCGGQCAITLVADSHRTAPPRAQLRCTSCGALDDTWSYQAEIPLLLPEGRAFWQTHRRIRVLAARPAQYHGRTATRLGIERVDGRAQLYVLTDPITGRVLHIKQT